MLDGEVPKLKVLVIKQNLYDVGISLALSQGTVDIFSDLTNFFDYCWNLS